MPIVIDKTVVLLKVRKKPNEFPYSFLYFDGEYLSQM
jgi:hypothetical protein